MEFIRLNWKNAQSRFASSLVVLNKKIVQGNLLINLALREECAGNAMEGEIGLANGINRWMGEKGE
jgi:hypothetical protein